MGAETAVAALASCALALAAFLLFLNRRRVGRGAPVAGPAAAAAAGAGLSTCPLCGAPLARGQTVKSVVFPARRAAGIEESMSRLYGCPRCWPVDPRHPRICPYCRKAVPADGWVIARHFVNGRTGKTHVHVLGCTGCRRGG